jgi:hypothetical protein
MYIGRNKSTTEAHPANHTGGNAPCFQPLGRRGAFLFRNDPARMALQGLPCVLSIPERSILARGGAFICCSIIS